MGKKEADRARQGYCDHSDAYVAKNSWWLATCPTHGRTEHNNIVGCIKCREEKEDTPSSSEDTSKSITLRWVECKANARLIAAAPDMLAALELITDEYAATIHPDAVEHTESIAAARTAIAKAKGK